MTTPNLALMQRYGTEDIFQEKMAGGLSLLERVGGGLAGAALSRNNAQVQAKHKMQAEQMNEMLRELELERVDLAGQLLRHTPVPRFASSNIPPGWDEGMVRMASVAALIGSDMAKEAGMGQFMGGIASGIGALGKGLGRGLMGGAGRVSQGIVGGVKGVGTSIAGAAGTVRNAATSAAGSLRAAPGQFGQKLTNLGNRAQGAGQLAGARVESAMTGQPSKMVSPLPKPATAAGAVAPAAAAAPAAGAAGAAGPSLADKMKGKLGLGWKGNAALLGTAAGALYLGNKALQKGTQVMGEEPGGPANYGGGQHGYQMSYGVNSYGQPQ